MKLKPLTAVTVALFISSFSLHMYDSRQAKSSVVGTELLQGLDFDRVTRIDISNVKNEMISLERSGDIFLLTKSKGYPADISKVNDFLYNLSSITIAKEIAEKTDKEMAVTKKNKKLKIDMFDSNKKLLSSLTIGKHTDKQGSFVKRNLDGRKFLTEKPIVLFEGKNDFINKTFFNLSTQEILSIKKLSPEVSGISRSKGKWRTAEGQEVDQVLANEFASKLSTLEFEEFYGASEKEVQGIGYPVSMEIVTSKDVTYQLNLGVKGKYGYAKVRALARDLPQGMQVGPNDDAKLLKLDETIRAKKQAASFNVLRSSWVFKTSGDIFDLVHEKFVESKKK